ncbi:hypothetical protein H6F74_27520 [Trichocoleus sp. FACHB-90]|uniref:hypothetical protein n=1 Tax=Cyanophyceae TaxID=3028117 RepID=UPI00168A3DE4|nr:hypothetical protein [Trichocoleus sp. FACHB-90]MBD1929951.1 hypothetical protein [Trichocoleus sp. FACHB-90]
MTHLRVQSRNDSEHEGTPQTDSLHDSSVNHTLIAIAQEVAELLKQAYPVQADDTDYLESTTRNHSSQSPLM